MRELPGTTLLNSLVEKSKRRKKFSSIMHNYIEGTPNCPWESSESVSGSSPCNIDGNNGHQSCVPMSGVINFIPYMLAIGQSVKRRACHFHRLYKYRKQQASLHLFFKESSNLACSPSYLEKPMRYSLTD